MIERYGDIWTTALAEKAEAVVITTNGVIKANGACVMGRGIAMQARDRYPGLDKRIGAHLREHGNLAGVFKVDEWVDPKYIITMPVKPAIGPRGEPGWKAKADPDLIKESALLVRDLSDMWMMTGLILMPRPGCGNGQLDWADVKPLISDILDDRFVAMHLEGM